MTAKHVVVECAACRRMIIVSVEVADQENLCADCDRVSYKLMATEDVTPIRVQATKERR